MAYQSLYRKYRSQTFGDLIGQDHVVRTLQNAIETGRIAHSYLFTGPRGTGKTSTARLLAKALCCENGPSVEFDNDSEICRSITEGSCIDVIEMDAASESGVDDIREQIVEAVEYHPMVCRYKVFIIDEVHDLSPKAFDALLKTVEEPPAHIIFILATTEFNKVPPTIRSRCQKYEFHRAGMQDLISRLEHVIKHEGIEAEATAVTAIARMADGGYRDALTLLEQAMLTAVDGKITLQQVYDQLGLVNEESVDAILEAIRLSDVPKLIDVLGEIARLGRDPRSILESLLHRLADLTRASYQIATSGLDSSREASLHELSTRIGRDLILRLRTDLSEAHKVIRDISLPRLWLESELIRLATSPAVIPVAAAAVPRPSAPEKPAARQEAAKPVEAIAAVESSGNPEFDAANRAWHTARAQLSQMSPTMAKKIEEVSLASAEGQTLVLQFERQMDYDWVMEKANRAPAIQQAVEKALGSSAQVQYVVRKRDSTSIESGAVELPLEGSRLEQLLKETFGQEPDPPTTV